MQEMIDSVLKTRGINIPEQDYKILTKQWALVDSLKKSIEKIRLDDLSIASLYIPVGVNENE